MESPHNKAVCKTLHQELNEFPYVQLSKVTTYRKSLKRVVTEDRTRSISARARQQRLWERRSKVITSDEKEAWKCITAGYDV